MIFAGAKLYQSFIEENNLLEDTAEITNSVNIDNIGEKEIERKLFLPVVFPEKVKSSHDPVKVLKVLRETSGIWADMKETGEEFVRRLRSEDNKRWKELGID
ncbi:MAG: hypothetical protein A4E53_00679 [Pelotomaculum sp. PtaB.Bin104]|nr:MAG: hypothetical protein A4E53_00679 [Pelotomaculum sp. PtaB.Bin104]